MNRVRADWPGTLMAIKSPLVSLRDRNVLSARLDQFIRHSIRLTEDLGMGDVVKRDGDDLAGRLSVSQPNRLEAGLTDIDAPNGLIFRHEKSP